MNTITDWQLSRLSYEMYGDSRDLEAIIFFLNLLCRRDAKGTMMITRELEHCDSCMRDYFVSLVSLRVAYTASIHSLTADLLEVLWTM